MRPTRKEHHAKNDSCPPLAHAPHWALGLWWWATLLLLSLPCSAAVQGQATAAKQEAFAYGDSSSATTATPDSPQPLDTIWSDTKAVFTEGLQIFSAPLRFGGTQWGIAGGVAAGTGLLMLADHEARELFAQKQDSLRNRLSEIGNYYGTLVPGLAVSSGLYAGGLVFDEPSVRRSGRRVFQAMLYAGTITTAAKMLIGRHRPFLNEGQYVFDGPSLKDEYFSLPSGHSTVAFAISSTLAAEIDHPVATVALYSLATLTAASRIYSDRHWLSDTFLGAAIGTACGYGVVHLWDEPASESSSWMILPTGNGLMVSWRGGQ
ncbi:MAG: phosphatase PAP2 family protein [Armatimonadetes bacterium]|nr:phosphatase PAP2 family protein [Armatimonadota bacterium]